MAALFREIAMIKEFYAVTTTSVYHVVGQPLTVTKIALSGESMFPVGHQMIEGQMLAVGTQLIKFIPEGGGYSTFRRDIINVNTRYWRDSSSPITALFLTKKKAMACFAVSDRKTLDSRWKEDTLKVLRAIGEDHPNISIYRGGSRGLPSDFEK